MSEASWRSWAFPVLLIVGIGACYQSLFIHYGINRLDESWQLYAAMQMHGGRVLYDEVLWVFPPGHVWTAWFAWWLDPPGIVFARIVYAVFDVALCVAVYFVARRVSAPPFALLAALLVTLAAPRGHILQLLFGYRYLVFCMLALLCLDRRLRGDGPAWLVAAGVLTGVAVTFRLTPAFAVSCGIAVALAATATSLRGLLADGLRFCAGLALAVAPVLIWFGWSVGLGTLFREVVLHPLAMLQPLPPPEIVWPEQWGRVEVYEAFVALQFRGIWLLYGGYLLGLAALWVRARRAGAPFAHGLLTATAVFGAVFFIRSTGRSDEPHLDSVVPPACLLFAHGAGALFERSWPRRLPEPGLRRVAAWALCAGILGAWAFLLGTDRMLDPAQRGKRPLRSLQNELVIRPGKKALQIDRTVALIRRHTAPDDPILDLSAAPLFYLLTGRLGPGTRDVVMPGIFLAAAEEQAFLEGLEANPPAAVIWPERPFDDQPSRSIWKTAPRVAAWVAERYRPLPHQKRWIVMLPKPRPGAPAGSRGRAPSRR